MSQSLRTSRTRLLPLVGADPGGSRKRSPERAFRSSLTLLVAGVPRGFRMRVAGVVGCQRLEFESDLIRLRTPEGMKVAKAKAGCVASSPSSTVARKRTSYRWCAAASTAPPRWPTSSASAARHLPRHRTATPRSESRSRGGDIKELTQPHGAGCPASDTPEGRRHLAGPRGWSRSRAGFSLRDGARRVTRKPASFRRESDDL